MHAEPGELPAEWEAECPGVGHKRKAETAAGGDPTKPPTQVYGRLRKHAAFWRTVVHSTLIMSWILSGFAIQWGAGGPPPPKVMSNHAGAMEYADFTTEAVAKLVMKGAVVAVCSCPRVVSPLNVVERRGKLRLVCDLTYVNSFIDLTGTKFRYETIHTATEVVQPNDLMFSVDLESAYHHVDMHPSIHEYLGFQWNGQYYVWRVLPFGLAPACWVFTKLMRELVGHWRRKGVRLIHYLDDLLFAVQPDTGGGTRRFRTTQQSVLADIRAAGLSVSEDKLELDPATRRKFLGFIIDSAKGVLEVTPVRAAELAQTLADITSRARSVPARLLAKACGQIASMGPALGHVARLYCRGMHRWLDTRVTWRSHLRRYEGGHG